MKTFIARYPTLFVSLSGLALILVQYIWIFLIPGLSDATRIVSAKITECLLAIFILGTLDWWRKVGFVPLRSWRDFVPSLPLLIIPLLMFVFQFNKFQMTNPVQLLIYAAVASMTGFAEEAIFRGAALCALRSKGIIRAVLLSSLIFGLLHFINLLNGADPLATVVQVVVAVLFGIAFAAPLLYTASIWPLVIIHALQDFISFWTMGNFTNTSTPPASEVLTTVILMLPFAAYGLWLIQRRIRMPLAAT
jgi:hypothetical protein